MTPDRYEVSPAGRRRLTGNLQKRSSKLWMSVGGGFALGGAFVAMGAVMILVGTKVLNVYASLDGAGYLYVTLLGVTFALGGLVCWGTAWRQFAANRARLEAARRHPNEPALADYPWHPDGFEVSEWSVLAKQLAGAVFVTIFLSGFTCFAFSAKDRTFEAVAILFDCALLAGWGLTARQMGRTLKFGHTRIEFPSFPCRLSNPIIVRWQPSAGINRVNKGTFTLRCVEEFEEIHGSGENRSVTLVHEEIWGAKWILEQPRNFPLKDKVELRYELPADAKPTELSAGKPIFWELEVKLDLPGLNFKETYLVPVYGPAETAASPTRV
jgi:hypothetical protein